MLAQLAPCTKWVENLSYSCCGCMHRPVAGCQMGGGVLFGTMWTSNAVRCEVVHMCMRVLDCAASEADKPTESLPSYGHEMALMMTEC